MRVEAAEVVSAGAGIAAEVGAEVEAVRVGVAEVASASAGIAAEVGAEIDAVAERRASSAAISPFAAVSSAAHGWTPPHTRAATFSTAVWPYDPALTWPMNSSA